MRIKLLKMGNYDFERLSGVIFHSLISNNMRKTQKAGNGIKSGETHMQREPRRAQEADTGSRSTSLNKTQAKPVISTSKAIFLFA